MGEADATRADALRAWFLGPRAENAALLERLVVESLRDHVFRRRNYHPEDGFTIREADKRREGYENAVATLTQELLGLLAELKRDVPLFSGRYKGHMLGEQTIAAQVGWFATMLYNPNNIAMDISRGRRPGVHHHPHPASLADVRRGRGPGPRRAGGMHD